MPSPAGPVFNVNPSHTASSSADDLLFVEPTDEMFRWGSRLASLFEPGSVLGMLLVTPIAHFANRSFEFQTYLYAVFHRTTVARVGHGVAMPVIVTAALACAFLVHPLVGVTAAVLLGAWYVQLCARERLGALGVAVVGVLALATALAGLWASRASQAPLWLHPLAVFFGAGLVQTLSHAVEDVPPRVSGSSRWVPVVEFFREDPVRNGLRAAVMIGAGLGNELWASWRLLPVLVLDGLWRLGYAPERRRAASLLVERACNEGNPAIDYIGTGGTAHTAAVHRQSAPARGSVTTPVPEASW